MVRQQDQQEKIAKPAQNGRKLRATPKRIRVLCVDDHTLTAEGIATRLSTEGDMEWIGHLARADTLVDEVRRSRPDVVLLDIDMPGADPFEGIEALRRAEPEIRTMILSGFVRDHYVDRAVDSGARGYFSKGDDPSDLVAGIRRVTKGEYAFGRAVAERMHVMGVGGRPKLRDAAPSRLESLTARERQILCLLGKGLSRAEIAKMLHRSRKTIDVHSTNIMRKLDIHDRVELSRFAIREGLVEA